MKRIGIIGGLGPEATTEYYKQIIGLFNEANPGGSLNYPEIIIYSVNMSRLIGYMNTEQYAEAIDYMSSCIGKLEKAGAEFAAISANTPHQLFYEIQEKSNIPLISIVDSARAEAERLSLKRTGLIGTRFTMRASFYADAFAKSGIEIIVPSSDEIKIIDEKLFTEMELGIFKDETRKIILNIVQRMISDDKIDSLVLGCTEFPIMFSEEKYLGIPFLNTTRLHVKEIVKRCLN